MSVIKDGSGAGRFAKVNSRNRLETIAESIPASVDAALRERAFFWSTPDITLTSDNTSAILYVKYTGPDILVISKMYPTVGESENATGSATDFVIRRNPTGGTVLSNGTEENAKNTNFGSNKIFVGTVSYGGEGFTIGNGEEFARARIPNGAFLQTIDLESNPVVLETNSTVGFEIDPPAGNTNQVIRIGFASYVFTERGDL